jgi:hypothetical protein
MQAGLVIVLSAVASGALGAPETAKTSTKEKPVAALAWLVSGVWTADASGLGQGMKRIETRYQWADNDAYIRFTTHFVSDKGTFKNYDGSFFWDPERSTLAVWYMDAANAITQCPVGIEGDTMRMEFHGADFEGKPADLRVNVVRATADRYRWNLEEKSGESWKPLLALEYVRTAGS